MVNYTPEQKQKLVSKLRFNLEKRISKLKHNQNKIIASLRYKSQSRLHTVPKKYWHLKIRDVLKLERSSRITFATLLNQLDIDIQKKGDTTKHSAVHMETMDVQGSDGITHQQTADDKMKAVAKPLDRNTDVEVPKSTNQ